MKTFFDNEVKSCIGSAIQDNVYKRDDSYLNNDVSGKLSRHFLIDFAVEIVVAEIELKIESFVDPDLTRIRTSFSVHFTAKNTVGLHPSNHVRSLIINKRIHTSSILFNPLSIFLSLFRAS